MRPSRRAAGRSACSRPEEAPGPFLRRKISQERAVVLTASGNIHEVHELDLDDGFLAGPVPKVLQRPPNDNSGERFAFVQSS